MSIVKPGHGAKSTYANSLTLAQVGAQGLVNELQVKVTVEKRSTLHRWLHLSNPNALTAQSEQSTLLNKHDK